MTAVPKTVEQRLANDPVIQGIMRDIYRLDQERKLREIAANPAKHKLTLIMGDKGAAYRYWKAGKDGRGREVRFCYSSWRNAAGYFLTWREVVGKTETKRDQFAARKVRKAAADVAKRRADAFKARGEP